MRHPLKTAPYPTIAKDAPLYDAYASKMHRYTRHHDSYGADPYFPTNEPRTNPQTTSNPRMNPGIDEGTREGTRE